MTARPWSRPWPTFLGQELQSLGVRSAAFEDRALSVADHAGIVGAAGEIRLVPVDNAFHALRAVKSDEELATIAEAARITDAAFVAATSDRRARHHRESAGVANRVRDARTRRGWSRIPDHRRRRTARRATASRARAIDQLRKASRW